MPLAQPETHPFRPSARRRAPLLAAALVLAAVAGSAGASPVTGGLGTTFVVLAERGDASDPAALCERATRAAGAETGVPLAILQAIALTESGRRDETGRRPWPWALNFGGPGAWFDSRDTALAALRAALAEGQRNIDVGCFQINHRWHAEAFASVEEMLDPMANARHAARFLVELHAETGSWSSAIGAYHSRTPAHAARYRAAVARNLAHLGADLATTLPAPEVTRAASPALEYEASGSPPEPAPVMPGSLFRIEGSGPGLLSGPRGALFGG